MLEIAKKVFEVEAEQVLRVGSRLDSSFERSVNTIIESSGKVVVCGMGKSGIIGKKISATLASTGCPSFFMHPAEAFHGDLGMVSQNDVFMGISSSGETEEIVKLIPFLKSNGNSLIAMTSCENSTLGRSCDIHLSIAVDEEACPLRLAPTSSTTATLVMGDALAIALMELRGFQPKDFARYHPGGSLGRMLLNTVEDEMRRDGLPLVLGPACLLDVLKIMTDGLMGIAIVETDGGFGLITDGDIRRAIETFEDNAFKMTASNLMTEDPICVSRGTSIADAEALMNRNKIHVLLVLEDGDLIGVFK